MDVKIRVPSDFSDELFEKLCSNYTPAYDGDTKTVRVNDDTLIGGFIIESDGNVIDMSVASQLKNMSKHIKN